MCQAEKEPGLIASAVPEIPEPETALLAECRAAGLFLDRELSRSEEHTSELQSRI